MFGDPKGKATGEREKVKDFHAFRHIESLRLMSRHT